ncbi:MAG: hypothetical protein ACLR0U_12485 [Enterocloster clostridioformis]
MRQQRKRHYIPFTARTSIYDEEACLKLGVELQAELALRLLKRSLT